VRSAAADNNGVGYHVNKAGGFCDGKGSWADVAVEYRPASISRAMQVAVTEASAEAEVADGSFKWDQGIYAYAMATD